MAHIVSKGKRPAGWEQIYKSTGAAQLVSSTIVRVYDTGTDADRAHNRTCPMLLNVTKAGLDVVVADSARCVPLLYHTHTRTHTHTHTHTLTHAHTHPRPPARRARAHTHTHTHNLP
jgi:hypothetical protein